MQHSLGVINPQSHTNPIILEVPPFSVIFNVNGKVVHFVFFCICLNYKCVFAIKWSTSLETTSISV